MKVVRRIDQVKARYQKAVVAIGVFDGIHLGHQLLLKKVVRRARAIGGTAMVMTFHPHPVHVLRPEENLQLLVSLSHRLRLIEQQGIDVCVVLRFTKGFSRLSPEKFIRRYLVEKIAAREVIVGDDFRFGQDRSGTLEFFRRAGKKYGFKVHTIPATRGGRKTVSSSDVRWLIAKGDLTRAQKLLNRRVSLFGKVVKGDGRGKILGYPTANINLSDEVMLPLGVYAVMVDVNGKKYCGIVNVGRRPSFKTYEKIHAEVHLLDFHSSLYGKEMIVEFLKKFRNEKRFSNPEALIQQIRRDEQRARIFFRSLQ